MSLSLSTDVITFQHAFANKYEQLLQIIPDVSKDASFSNELTSIWTVIVPKGIADFEPQKTKS